jgi:hypothetical protein
MQNERRPNGQVGTQDFIRLLNKALPENFCHLLRHDARDDVAGTARGKWHDHGDGARRINLPELASVGWRHSSKEKIAPLTRWPRPLPHVQ